METWGWGRGVVLSFWISTEIYYNGKKDNMFKFTKPLCVFSLNILYFELNQSEMQLPIKTGQQTKKCISPFRVNHCVADRRRLTRINKTVNSMVTNNKLWETKLGNIRNIFKLIMKITIQNRSWSCVN